HRLIYAWMLFLLIAFSGKGLGWYARYYAPDKQHVRLRGELLQALPNLTDKKVAVIEKVVAHLARIPHVYLLDQWEHAEAIVIAYPQGDHLWQYSRKEIEQNITGKLDSHWQLTLSQDLAALLQIH